MPYFQGYIHQSQLSALLQPLEKLANRLCDLKKVSGNQLCFKFQESPLIKAVRQGDWALVHDINCLKHEHLAGILTLFERSPSITVKNGKVLTIENGIHKDFRLIAIMDQSRPSSFPLNDVTRNRCIEIFINPPHARDHLSDIILHKDSSIPKSIASFISHAHIICLEKSKNELSLYQLLSASTIWKKWTLEGVNYLQALASTIEEIYGRNIREELFSKVSLVNTLQKIKFKKNYISERGEWKLFETKFNEIISQKDYWTQDRLNKLCHILQVRLENVAVDWFDDSLRILENSYEILCQNWSSLIKNNSKTFLQFFDYFLSVLKWMRWCNSNFGLGDSVTNLLQMINELKTNQNLKESSDVQKMWIIDNFENISITRLSHLPQNLIEKLLNLSKDEAANDVVISFIISLYASSNSIVSDWNFVIDDEILPLPLIISLAINQQFEDIKAVYKEAKIVDQNWRNCLSEKNTDDIEIIATNLIQLFNKRQEISLLKLSKMIFFNSRLLEITKFVQFGRDRLLWYLPEIFLLKEILPHDIDLYIGGHFIGTHVSNEKISFLGNNKVSIGISDEPNSEYFTIGFDHSSFVIFIQGDEDQNMRYRHQLPENFNERRGAIHIHHDFESQEIFHIPVINYLSKLMVIQTNLLLNVLWT